MIGSIEVVQLSDEEKQRHKETMRVAHAALKDAAGKISVRKMAEEYFSGNLILSDEKLVHHLQELKELEPVLISGYILTVNTLVDSFGWLNQSYFSKSDWWQEAAMAIREAVYGYDGVKAEFSTLAWYYVKNRFLKLRLRFEKMDLRTTALDEEFQFSINDGKSRREYVEVVTDQMQDEKNRQESVKTMRDQIRNTKLTPREREVIDFYLQGGDHQRGWQVEMAKQQGVSKQGISGAFREASRKIQKTAMVS